MSFWHGLIPDCPSGKKGYGSRKGAKAAMAEIAHSRKHHGKLAAYNCDHCGWWHLGTMPHWKRNGLERPNGYGVSQQEAPTDNT